MYNRRKSRVVRVGGVAIGGDHPITIQSMTTTQTADVAATLAQVRALTDAGCEIVRLAVNNAAAAAGFAEIKRRVTNVPLVADIHFDYRLAISAIEAGADKIRINPGNIGDVARVAAVVDAAKSRRIPIRVGVNSGSLELDLVDKYNGVTAEGLAESALRNVQMLEDLDFGDIVVSIKAANIPMTLRAHEILAPQVDYPLHIGITEAGTLYSGTIKSTAGLAAMLTRGFGDTVRISLTADPVEEVAAAKEMLKALRLRQFGPEIISCPTCGRTEMDLISLVDKVTRSIEHITTPMTVAIMGCAVNGPGEAKECDIGLACSKDSALLFCKGEIIRKVSTNEMVAIFVEEIEKLAKEMTK
ncbi:MAG: flavodoxin-dependent (E)-4-hydroxy-3-methylbut-2-enyl-diphosphate synthase [Defluviitaleaceae bacterium]|nr:flavodoxin-dependent (E)-4-hydroxy-3-methylbut-2-enyl-diphosphate synthase [Defluviitaleaceae bacterium]